MMLTDNNQIFRNSFVIIYCHLTKVSSPINKCIIFEPNELSITLSTIWCHQSFPAQESWLPFLESNSKFNAIWR